jgi:hypothetical protein
VADHVGVGEVDDPEAEPVVAPVQARVASRALISGL